MTDVYQPELMYETKVNNHSTTIYRTITPQAPGSVTTSVTSSVGSTDLIIPASCFNFANSRLNFTLNVPGLAANSTYINANLLTALSRVVIYDSATNAVWADVSNFEKYASLISSPGTQLDKFLTKSYSSGTPASAASAALAITAAQLVTVEDISKCNVLGAAAVPNVTGSNQDTAAQNQLLARRQFYYSTAATNIAIDVSIPFDAFKLTCMSLPQVIYNPANTVVQLFWSANDNYAFTATAANPTTATASLVTPITISNINIALANEANLQIISGVIDKVMKQGLSLNVAYPTVTRQSIASSAAHSYQLNLSRGYGQRILSLISAPFSAAAGVNFRNVHDRGNLTTYNTFLNNVPIKANQGFDCTKSTDYTLANKEYMIGSALQTLGEYSIGEWFHCDSFVGERPIWAWDQTMIDGLDTVSQSSTWSIQANLSAATAYVWITAIVAQKVLTLSSMGSSMA